MVKSEEEIIEAYPLVDERGRYRNENLTGPLHSTAKEDSKPHPPSSQPWHGYDVYARGRCWSAPKTGTYAQYIDEHLIPNYSTIEGIHERLDALDKAGLIHHPKRGVWPGLKRYAAADRGNPPQNLILKPTGFTNFSASKKGKEDTKVTRKKQAAEYTGYPTQKPLELLNKFIVASCPPDGIVFDPFCGCATTLVSAEINERQWVGIDLSEKAQDLLITRIRNHTGQLLTEAGADYFITHRTSPPIREDYSPEEWQEQIAAKQKIKPYNCSDNKQKLFGQQEGTCNGCFNHYPYKLFEVDHIKPMANGGGDDLENLQLLCGHCNKSKGKMSEDEFWKKKLAEKEKELAEYKQKLNK